MKALLTIVLILVFTRAEVGAQWVQTSGPEGGAIFALFSDGSNLYAGTNAAGVFRSTDGGASWEQKINGLGYQATTVINKCGEYLLASGTVGLYRSTDHGDSWTAATGLPAANGVSCLAVIGANVFAGTMGKGVYASTDSGGTWAPSNSGLPNSGVNVGVGGIAAVGSTLLASATNNSVQGPMYRSTDLGGTWAIANTGLPPDFFQYNAMCSDGSTVYAGGTRLYKTTNNGDSWTAADNGIPQFSGISDIKASGSSVFAAAAYYMYRSTDGGGSWSPLGGGLPFMNMASAEIAGSVLYAGTIADGVYKSTDNGDSWSAQISGLKARDMNNFVLDGSTLYGNGNSIFKTIDAGDAWTGVRGDLKDSSSQPTLLYANGLTLIERDYPVAGLERSTDGGATWSPIGSGLPSVSSLGAIISTGGALIAADSRVYRSLDNGDTWVQVDTAIGGFVGFSSVTMVGSTVWASGAGIIKSTDNGSSWVRADSGIAAFFGVAGFANVGTTLFAGGGFPNAIYKSTDDGAHWRTVTNLPSGGGTSQLLGLGNDLYACSPNNGIFISKNLGSTWTKISTGLPNPNYAFSLAISEGMMFAGTSGNSVWKRPVSDVTAVREATDRVPGEFSLDQNYPNPFNPVTNFAFRISNIEYVTLKVYDVLGREAASLVNRELHPGAYHVRWDAGMHPSGVYYYRLQSRSKNEVRKMMLTK